MSAWVGKTHQLLYAGQVVRVYTFKIVNLDTISGQVKLKTLLTAFAVFCLVLSFLVFKKVSLYPVVWEVLFFRVALNSPWAPLHPAPLQPYLELSHLMWKKIIWWQFNSKGYIAALHPPVPVLLISIDLWIFYILLKVNFFWKAM